MLRVPLASLLYSLAGLCTFASAQPKLLITSLGSDLAASGNGAVGFVYDHSIQEYVPYTWTRGIGYSRISGAFPGDGELSCSDDMSVLAMCSDNTENWGDLNCFNGYCFGNMTGCVPGTPRPPLSPCWVAGITHRWTAQTGWVNTGSFTRMLDPGTGRYFGGTRCDYGINFPSAVSGDGRLVIGSGWFAQLTTSSGGPGFGLCGDFYGFVYDSVNRTIRQLPAMHGTSRADRANYDGSVITGYDLDPAESLRRTCVWRNGVQTILDAYRGAKDNAGVNGPGTILASGGSVEFVAANFPGQVGVRLVRWHLQGDAWVPENLGKPVNYLDPDSGVPIAFGDLWVTGVSDDGNTILGMAQYGAAPPSLGGLRRPFIWSPGINRGVPIDLETYVASLGSPNDPLLAPGLSIYYASRLSANGNAALVYISDARDTCPAADAQSLDTYLSGILYLNGSQVSCDAPRIGLGPVDTSSTQYTPFGVALNVVASGSWPLTYRWQGEVPGQPGTWADLPESCANFDRDVDWDFEGVYKNQLRVGEGACGADRAGRYRVVVSNSCGSVTSEPAMVTFNQVPWMIRQPDDAGTCAGGEANFTAVGSYSPNRTYQWQMADASVSGGWADLNDGFIFREGLPAGSFTGADAENAQWLGQYPDGQTLYLFDSQTFRCVVSSGCGSVTSDTATLSLCACFACPADFNQDGGVDGADVGAFYDRWEAGHCDADTNADGGVDGADVETFFTAWEAGGC